MPKQVGIQTTVKTGAVTGSVGSPTPAVEPPGDPSAIVSGAGTAAANGTYTLTGTNNDRPFYNKAGTNPVVSAISWSSTQWIIFGSGGEGLYLGSEDVAFPWLDTYFAEEGANPSPTVSEG